MVAYGGVRWVVVWLMLVIGMDFLWWWANCCRRYVKVYINFRSYLTSDDPTITIYCSWGEENERCAGVTLHKSTSLHLPPNEWSSVLIMSVDVHFPMKTGHVVVVMCFILSQTEFINWTYWRTKKENWRSKSSQLILEANQFETRWN